MIEVKGLVPLQARPPETAYLVKAVHEAWKVQDSVPSGMNKYPKPPEHVGWVLEETHAKARKGLPLSQQLIDSSIEETCRWIAEVLAQPVTKISDDIEIEDDGTATSRLHPGAA